MPGERNTICLFFLTIKEMLRFVRCTLHTNTCMIHYVRYTLHKERIKLDEARGS